jgi:hypothetical protein
MYLSQWINDSNVALLEDGRKSFDLVATDTDSAVDGVRLVLVQLNNSTIVSVELLNASGDNQHLLRNRVVVHQIEVAGVVGFERRHTVLDADLHIGESFSQGKIDITVEQITSENSVTSAKIKVLIAS